MRGGLHELGMQGQLSISYAILFVLQLSHDTSRNLTDSGRDQLRRIMSISTQTSAYEGAMTSDDLLRIHPINISLFTLTDGGGSAKISITNLRIIDIMNRITEFFVLSSIFDMNPSLGKVRRDLAKRWEELRVHVESLPPSNISSTDIGPEENVYDACRLAVLICSTTPQTRTEVVLTRTHDLKVALQKTNVADFGRPFPGVLLWCLAIAVSVPEMHESRTWHLLQLSRISHAFAVGSWTLVSQSLRTIELGIQSLRSLIRNPAWASCYEFFETSSMNAA
jgi:hypothetical protein